MTTVGFCGLGQMGFPMARRLVTAGYDVRGWNRTRSKAESLEGATVARSPADAAGEADFVLTMLSTPQAASEVIAGDEGVATSLPSQATLIEMSTIGPADVLDLHESLPQGAAMLDAPVLGSIPQATEGELKLFVGGDTEVIEGCRDLLENFGTIWPMGDLGQGAAMKLVVNSTLGALMTALGEALALAKALGLDRERVLDVLAESPIATPAKGKRSNVLTGTYKPNFKLELAAKDMRLVHDAAAGAGVELKVAQAARQWFEAADAAGLSELDYSAVLAQILNEPAEGRKA
jgi:3-hydroxyisobutyrate dehydrogenase-like beta-hydroxyacid dehydrogenase